MWPEELGKGPMTPAMPRNMICITVLHADHFLYFFIGSQGEL